MNRINRFFVFLVVFLLVSSIAPASAHDDVPDVDRYARVRVGYFAFDPQGFDTFVDGEVFPFADEIINVGWARPIQMDRINTASHFFEFRAGSHSFAVAPKGKGITAAILGPIGYQLEPDHAYSLAIVGSVDAHNLDLLIVDDTQVLADADPKTTFVSIFVNNVRGIPVMEVNIGKTQAQVNYGRVATHRLPAGTPLSLKFYASGEAREFLYSLDSLTLPGLVSDLEAMYGSFPGTYNKQYFFAANWSYLGKISVIDGGTITVGSETTGEVTTVGQRRKYALTLATDMVLNLRVIGMSQPYKDTLASMTGTFDPVLYVFDANGGLLDWNDDVSWQAIQSGDANARLENLALKPGTYRIEVGGSGDLVSGAFKLIVEAAKRA
jgi:hypothetical protein